MPVCDGPEYLLNLAESNLALECCLGMPALAALFCPAESWVDLAVETPLVRLALLASSDRLNGCLHETCAVFLPYDVLELRLEQSVCLGLNYQIRHFSKVSHANDRTFSSISTNFGHFQISMLLLHCIYDIRHKPQILEGHRKSNSALLLPRRRDRHYLYNDVKPDCHI